MSLSNNLLWLNLGVRKSGAAQRTILLEELSRHNVKIVEAEVKLAPSFRATLETQLEEKKKELSALEHVKPQAVENPAESPDAKAQAEEANAILIRKEEILEEIKKAEAIANQKRADAVRGSIHVVRIAQALKNHQQVHKNFLNELEEMLGEISAPFSAEDLVKLTITPDQLSKLDEKYKAEIKEQEDLLSPEKNLSLTVRRREIEADVQATKNQLGEKQRQFILYRDRLAAWEKSRADLLGDKDKPTTIAGLRSLIEDLDTLPTKLNELRALRQVIVRNLHRLIQKMVQEYKVLYQPVQQFVASAPQQEIGLPLAFDVRIAAKETFQRDFLERINRSAKGSFSGIEESNALMQGLISETDFNNEDAVVAFSERVDDLLHFDRRQGLADAPAMLVPDQLRSEQHAENLYDQLFGLSYLTPQYSLTYQNQEISQLSPGERGLLLLVFYLLVDKDDIPLLIDQPEENLDNQTIFRILVQCIKAAKQKRQVIMVTHNPNLAVVCDAEQIICASCDKTAKRFDYISGAIESEDIRTRVIEILEGTQPAFINRRDKYGLRA